MTIVAYSHQFVVGVDTHARKHVFAIIAVPSGERIDNRDFPVLLMVVSLRDWLRNVAKVVRRIFRGARVLAATSTPVV